MKTKPFWRLYYFAICLLGVVYSTTQYAYATDIFPDFMECSGTTYDSVAGGFNSVGTSPASYDYDGTPFSGINGDQSNACTATILADLTGAGGCDANGVTGGRSGGWASAAGQTTIVSSGETFTFNTTGPGPHYFTVDAQDLYDNGRILTVVADDPNAQIVINAINASSSAGVASAYVDIVGPIDSDNIIWNFPDAIGAVQIYQSHFVSNGVLSSFKGSIVAPCSAILQTKNSSVTGMFEDAGFVSKEGTAINGTQVEWTITMVLSGDNGENFPATYGHLVTGGGINGTGLIVSPSSGDGVTNIGGSPVPFDILEGLVASSSPPQTLISASSPDGTVVVDPGVGFGPVLTVNSTQYGLIEVKVVTEKTTGDFAEGDSVSNRVDIQPADSPYTNDNANGTMTFTLSPGVDIETSTNGQDADVVTGPTIAVGDLVTWVYTVVNIGTADLTNVTVTDNMLANADIDCGSGSNVIPSLSAGFTAECTATGVASAGQYINTGTVMTDEGVTDTDDSHYMGEDVPIPPIPAIEVNKTAVDGADTQTIQAGDDATFNISITNTGEEPLTNVVVDDPFATCIPVLTTLGVDETYMIVCTTSSVTADFTNIVTVTAEGVTSTDMVSDSDQSDVLVTIPVPAIAIEKATNSVDADSAPGVTVEVGSPVSWLYIVANTGEIELSNITVTDSDPSVTIICPSTNLLPNEDMTCEASGVAVEGQYSNTGTVVGMSTFDSSAVSDTDMSHYIGIIVGDEYEDDDSCATASQISVDGTVQAHDFHVGADVDWVKFNAVAGKTYQVEANVPGLSTADISAEIHYASTLLEEEPTFAPGIRLEFESPLTEVICVKLSDINGNFGDDVTYNVLVRELRESVEEGVVVIVGGRLKLVDKLQDNIYQATNSFYRAFHERGYLDADTIAPGQTDRIYYLTTDLTLDPNGNGTADVDTLPALGNLEYALTDWAKERLSDGAPLTLYMIGHGDDDEFYLDGTLASDPDPAEKCEENPQACVGPDDLNQMLAVLEAEYDDLQINIIIEACRAGSFIEYAKSISKPGRTIITSTDADLLAYGTQVDHDGNGDWDGVLFSDAFTYALSQNMSIFNAFQLATGDIMNSSRRGFQVPWIDDNGDGEYDPAVDGQSAAKWAFDTATASLEWQPYIPYETNITPVIVDPTNGQGAISVEVRDDEGIEAVWVVVYPPSYTPPDSSTTGIVEDDPQTHTFRLPLSELTADGGIYAGNLWFPEVGEHIVEIYARDNEGRIGRPRTVTVNNPVAVALNIDATPIETTHPHSHTMLIVAFAVVALVTIYRKRDVAQEVK